MAKNYESLGCLHDMFRRQAEKTPDAVAIVTDDGLNFTLGEVDQITDRLAQIFIQKYNVKVGSPVGIYMDKSPEYVFVYIAALKAGAAYFPLDVSYPQPLLETILEESEPPVVCTKPGFAKGLLTAGCPMFVFEDEWLPKLSKVSIKGAEWPKVSLDDMAYLVYSSGTTGKPKGIQCPHRGSVFSYSWRLGQYPLEPNDRVACNVFFTWELLRSLLIGTPLYIIPDDVIYDPPALCRFLKRHQITHSLFTPSLLQTILDTVEENVVQEAFKSMKQFWLCGEVLTVSLLKQTLTVMPWVQVMNMYSVSETHDVSAVDLSKWYASIKNDLESGKSTKMFAPAGHLLPGVQVVIMDDNLNPQPIGVSGEIYVGGPPLALGYFKRPDLNKTRFIESPTPINGQKNMRLYKTGDWGFLLSDGNMEICGRCDSMVKIRGYTVEIQAIESTLNSLSCVNTCSVIAQGKEGEDKHVIAYVVLQEKVSRKELRAMLKQRLPFYMIPSYFVYMDRLPLLAASSKTDKKALPPVDLSRDVTEVESLPRTPTEKKLAHIWMKLLNLVAVDIQESFFDLGGHSLLAARLLNDISEDFGKRLSMQDLFQHPTVEGLARVLDGIENGLSNGYAASLNLADEVEKHDLKEAVMDLYLRAFWRSLGRGDRWKKGCVFLTGATGFVGSFILKELLTSSEVHVICLVRDTPDEAPEARLRRVLKGHGLMDEQMDAWMRERVFIFKGDVGLKRMGLNEDDYQFLSYDVDFVIHAAAYVNLIYPYEALHGGNVLGTQNVLLFCYSNKIKPLHYISSNAVVPNGGKNVMETRSVGDVWTKLTDGYAQSKWVAEQLVVKAMERGFPAVSYRLGNQAGPSSGAAWNVQDYTYLIWSGCATVGYAPDLEWDLEFTPVDFTARLIVAAATRKFALSVGKIYHLISGERETPNWKSVCFWFNKLGYKLLTVPYKTWTEEINEAVAVNESNKNLQLLGRLVDSMLSDESFFASLSSYDRTNVEELLGSLGWTYPKIDENQLAVWVRKMSAVGLMPRPSTGQTKLLEGKSVIITGGSSGIGRGIAEVLAIEGGARVVLGARRIERLEGLRAELQRNGGDSIAVKCDVTKREEVKHLMSEAEKAFGPVDILINNAGVMYYTMMKTVNEEQWEHQIDVNCKGTMNCIGAVLQGMVQRRAGHIINITSDAGRKAFVGLGVYSGTKFFIEGMASALRQEVAEFGIRVTNVQPGDVKSELLSLSSEKEAVALDVRGAGHKVMDPEDIGRAVLYALSQPPHVGVNEILIEPTATPV